MSEKSYCLCLKPSTDPCLNIFSVIGVEMKMVQILSEYFKWDVIKTNVQTNVDKWLK